LSTGSSSASGAPSIPNHPGAAELGRYRLTRHLATGGMGEVYLAEAVGAAGFAKRVVIKVLRADLASDAELVRQLIAEGRLLEALDHPNIAQILDIGQADELFWLAMEYVEGWDLRAVLRALPVRQGAKQEPQGPLGPSAVLHVIASVARALDHAQSRRGPDGQPLRIVHHDVSPSNVMVRHDGHVKLVDFGVARAALLGRLSAGALRGKLPYLSPEHSAALPVDGRADLFALGLVAYELLTGERALEVTEPKQLERAYQRLPAKLAALRPQLPQGLFQLISELLALDQTHRPAHAAAVTERAERLLIDAGEPSPSRRLAQELAPAFARLEAKTASFDQTLHGILGLADRQGQPELTGTLSLPGLDVVKVAAASARDQLTPGRRPRKRWITAGLVVVLAAIAGGFWMGRRTPTPPAPNDAPLASNRRNSIGIDRGRAGEPAVAARLPATASAVAAADPPAVETAAAATQLAATGPGQGPSSGPGSLPLAPSPTPVVKAADGGEDDKPKLKKAEPLRTAILLFRVQPFSCQVSVDGARQRPVGESDRYEVRVAPGDHRIQVRDPASGQQKDVWVRKIADDERRVLPGGICLGEGCPTAP
jgi:serine/threonine protein kinase